MKFSILGLVSIAGLALIFGGCGRRAGTALTVAGSTAFQPFAEKLAEQFMARRPDINITVQGGGSALGIQAARSGAAQIGMADLVELPPEAAELLAVTVARDSIAIIVNTENTATNLSLEQIRGIFQGGIKNWQGVGGSDHPVRVISREAGSGTRSSFEAIIGGITLAKTAIIQDSNGTIRETVANDRDAAGYLSHGLLNEKVKALSVDGVECTEKEIAAGRYKLVRPVFLLVQPPLAGAAHDFIDHILSAEGQAAIRQDGLLPAK